jgi:hypothetical protein
MLSAGLNPSQIVCHTRSARALTKQLTAFLRSVSENEYCTYSGKDGPADSNMRDIYCVICLQTVYTISKDVLTGAQQQSRFAKSRQGHQEM